MKIHTATFVTSALTQAELPEWELPEIALVGRSNVGKSSFINTILNRKNLAYTSNTPGKTQRMHFYEINQQFAFVDFPGYGYAKVSKKVQLDWRKHFESYLLTRRNLIHIIQLLDIRHAPQAADIQMQSWLKTQPHPVCLILTKADKISRSEVSKQVSLAAKTLDVSTDQLLPFSTKTGLGKETALHWIQEWVSNTLEVSV